MGYKLCMSDISKLASKDFDYQAYIKRQIATLDDNGLQELKSRLKLAHKQAEEDVHHVLLSNFKTFLNLSEKMTAIEVEQMSISNIIQQVKGIFKTFELDAVEMEMPLETQQSGVELQQEIVDLEEIVGNIDRKVVHISYYCYHITGNYPDKKIYRVFLFTNTLVITVRKKKGQHSRTKEYVDGFIPLGKLILNPSEENEINLLHADSQTAYKLRFEKLKNKEDTYEQIKQILVTVNRGQKSLLRNQPSQVTIKSQVGTITESFTITTTQSTQFNEIMDQFNDSMHMREFDKCGVLYSQADKLLNHFTNKDTIANGLRTQLASKHKELSDILLHQLNNPTISKKHVDDYTRWLIGIGMGDEAAEVFLLMRSALIKKRARSLIYQGDVVHFISDLSFVLFSLIRNTGDWYISSFKDAMMISIYVKWAKTEVFKYCEICKRHLNQNQFLSLRKVAQTLYQIEQHAEIVIQTHLVE